MGISDIMQTGDVWRAIHDLRRELQNLTSGRRLEDASIGARGLRLLDGGSLTISGGAIRMTDETGSVGLLYFGPSSIGQPTWLFSFDDGEIAGGLHGSPGSNYWRWNDRAGNEILAGDGQSGVGFSKPYFNIPMYPSSGTSVGTGGPFWPQFTNTSYQEVMHGITTLWHPRIRVGVATSTSGGTVDWQLQIDGTVIASGSGTGNGTGNVPDWGEENGINPGDQKSVQLWCRNTSGTASRVIIDYCYGLQS